MKYLIALAVVIAALTGLIVGVGAWESRIEARGKNACEAVHATAAEAAQSEQRAIEQRRAIAQQEARDANQKEVELARADSVRDRAAVVGLRGRIAELTRNRGTGIDLTVAGGGSPAGTLGELFGDCAEKYQSLGDEAAVARAAGKLCERTYDALSIRAQIRANLKQP